MKARDAVLLGGRSKNDAPSDTIRNSCGARPIVIIANGETLRGFAEGDEHGGLIFEPACKAYLSIGCEVTWSWVDGHNWGRGRSLPDKRRDSLVTAQRFTVFGADRYLLVDSQHAMIRRGAKPSGRDRRRGRRVDTLTRPIEAGFRLAPDQARFTGMVDNISISGAALAVAVRTEQRCVGVDDIELDLALFPDRGKTKIRGSIKNRRLAQDYIVWGIAFRFETSPEPIRAESMVRDYLIQHQLDLMKKNSDRLFNL